jgi:peptidoglycan/xylan/chitin deacetylase (PgdA/CDA1 family)
VTEVLLPVTTGGLLAAWAVRGRSSQVFGASSWRGTGERRSVALTFDDGPSESTPELLELLDRFGVKATFFQVGSHVRRLPDIARSVSASGHEIGNHTDHHARLWLRLPAFLDREISGAQATLEQVHGKPPCLFRAPYGVRWPGLSAIQQKHGLLGVMWTILGRDWRLPAVQAAPFIRRHAQPGAIVCLHDGRELAIRPDIRETIETVRLLIPSMLEVGYSFETVSSILCPKTSPNA